MKRGYCWLAVGIVAVLWLPGSFTYAAGVSLTVRAGVSIANQTFSVADGSAEYNRDRRFGGIASIGLGIPLIGGLELSPELAVVQKGSDETLQGIDEFNRIYDYKQTYRIDYASVRGLARLSLPVVLKGLYATGGLRADVKLETKWTTALNPASGTVVAPPWADEPETVVLGAVLGLGHAFSIAPGLKMVLHGEYDFDVTKSWKPNTFPLKVGSPTDIKNRSVHFMLGLQFGT